MENITFKIVTESLFCQIITNKAIFSTIWLKICKGIKKQRTYSADTFIMVGDFTPSGESLQEETCHCFRVFHRNANNTTHYTISNTILPGWGVKEVMVSVLVYLTSLSRCWKTGAVELILRPLVLCNKSLENTGRIQYCQDFLMIKFTFFFVVLSLFLYIFFLLPEMVHQIPVCIPWFLCCIRERKK